LANSLFEVKPTDPSTFAVVVSCLVGVSIVAALVPAYRATRMRLSLSSEQ
jgi:hypothetical protein